MHASGKLIGIIALTLLAGCAAKSDLVPISADLDELKTRQLKTERSLAAVKNEAREAAAAEVAPFEKELDRLRKGTADFQASLDSLRVDLQSMGGKVDDTANLAKRPSEDVALLREDTGRRFKTLEDRIQGLEKGLEEIQVSIVELRNRDLERSPETLYQKGLDTYRSGDSAKGRELFSRFISLYPRHELAANAHYWIGETYYSEKKFDQAILEFQEVIKDFPGREKVPAAMLKQAMAFRELADTKSSRYVLKKLTDDFPNTEEARTAREMLKESAK